MPYSGGIRFGDASGTFSDTDGTFSDIDPDVLFPQILVELSASPPDVAEPATWIAVDEHVVAVGISRGRDSELDEVAAGACTLTLDGTGGLFDPEYTSSPYFDLLTPNRRVRVRALWDSTYYPLFDGYVDFWPAVQPGHDYVETAVQVSDAFRLLATRRMRPARPFTIEDATLGALDDPLVRLAGGFTFGEQLSGVRAAEILDMAGWPSGLADIDQGLSLMVADEPDPAGYVLPYLQRLARSEYGDLYVSAAGMVTFRERRAWTRTSLGVTSQATYGDSGAALACATIEVVAGSPDRIRNVVVRGRADGRTATARDGTSVAAYGPIESSQTDLLVSQVGELADQAGYVLGRWAEPAVTVSRLELRAEHDPSGLLPEMLSRELGDRVTVTRTPVTGGSPVSAEFWVEGIDHEIDVRDRTMTTVLRLSPAESPTYFTVGDATLGVIDSVAVLAY